MAKEPMQVYRRKPLCLKAATVGLSNIHILAEKFGGSVVDVRTPYDPDPQKVFLVVPSRKNSSTIRNAYIGDILAYNEATGDVMVYDQLKFLSQFELVTEPTAPTYLEN